jgi:hypothetical protein
MGERRPYQAKGGNVSRTLESPCRRSLDHSCRKRGTVPRSSTPIHRPESRVGDEVRYDAVRRQERDPKSVVRRPATWPLQCNLIISDGGAAVGCQR